MRKYIISLIAIMLTASCSTDFLEVEPSDRYSDATVWADKELVNTFVNNIYLGQYYGYHTVMLSSLCDEAMEVWSWESSPITMSEISPSYVGILAPDFWVICFSQISWNALYKQIRACNVFFENIEKYGLEGDDIERLKGEVHYLRAYYYYWLMAFHGGVPLIDRSYTTSSSAEELQVSRNTFEETVDFIVKDLDEAAATLSTSTDKARASKGAALALKARVLLYAASDLYNNPSWATGYNHPELIGYTSGSQKERWQKAKDAAKAVIDLGIYQLYGTDGGKSIQETIDNYANIWLNNGSDEDIMLTFFDTENFGTGNWQCPSVGKFNAPNGWHCWGGNVPTAAMIDSYDMADGSQFSWDNPEHNKNPYENRDPRFYATVLYDGAKWRTRPDDVIASDPNGTVQTGYYENADGSYTAGLDTRQGIDDWNGTYTGYYMRKFIDPNIDHQYEFQQYPYRQMRYAEVLLNYAEACIELGEDAEARKYINMIRRRAGMPEFDDSETGDALRQHYRRERKIELAYEGSRFFDIRRWMIAPDVLKTAQGVDIRHPYDSDQTVYTLTDVQERQWKNKLYFLPILMDEMNKNPNLIQNPEY